MIENIKTNSDLGMKQDTDSYLDIEASLSPSDEEINMPSSISRDGKITYWIYMYMKLIVLHS